MRGPHALHAGFWLVFGREWRHIGRRPFLLALSTIIPLALMAILIVVYSAGLATKLPIAVLDLDGSDLSRTIVRMVDAAPDVSVAHRVADLAEGRAAILSGLVHGLLMLPHHLQRDVSAGRRPDVVFFYNTQRLTTGNIVLKGVNAAVPAVAGGIRIALRTAQGEPADIAQAALQPIPVQVHPLFNPTLNYGHFLLSALIPAILQIVVTVTLAYTVGLDVATPHRLRILRRLGNGLWPAVFGKLAPYLILFLVVLGGVDAVLYAVFDLPLRGSGALLVTADILFIAALALLGSLLALTLRSTGTAISIATMMTAPAFGFMGIGFPRLGMNAFAYGYGALLPGTWFVSARIDQTIRGTPLDLSWPPILILLAFVIGLAGLVAARLEGMRNARDVRTAKRLSDEVTA